MNAARQPMKINQDHWQSHAAQWHNLGSPLRPCPQDIHTFEAIAAHMYRPRALLLGVTPELALMRWPAETRLLAVDRSPDMIANVWPPATSPWALAVCGDWLQPPLVAGRMNLVIGDGCLTILPFPHGYRQVAKGLHELLAPHGRLALRFFVRPKQQERVADIFVDLQQGRINSFHACKWRLAMALHGPDGVRLADIWQTWHEAKVTINDLVTRPGWSAAAMSTINNYRDVNNRYTFPTLAEIRHIFAEFFDEESTFWGDYELGDRCPILVFTTKRGKG